MTLLHVVLWACWLLAGGIVLLSLWMVGRRHLRLWMFQRRDRWRDQLGQELSRWIVAGGPPALWRRHSVHRAMLLEALIQRIELEGRECEQTQTCSLVGPGVDLPCVPPPQPCQGPGFFRRLAGDWGLVEQQMTRVRRARGLQQARALIQLGRLRQPRTISFLASYLESPDTDVRLAATRALGLVGTLEAAEPLLALLPRDKLAISRPSIQRALMSCCAGRPEVLLPHILSLAGPRKALLARVLAELATPALLPDLRKLADAEQPQIRAEVARALSRLPEADSVPLLVWLARDPVWFVRVRALRALAKVGEWETLDVLLEGLNSRHPDVRQAAAESLAEKPFALDDLLPAARPRLNPEGWGALLGELGRTGLFWVLCQQLKSPSEPTRTLAEQWLRAALDAGVTKSVLDTLGHPNPAIVEGVTEFLARSGDHRVLARLDAMIIEMPPWSPHRQRLVRVRQQITDRAGA